MPAKPPLSLLAGDLPIWFDGLQEKLSNSFEVRESRPGGYIEEGAAALVIAMDEADRGALHWLAGLDTSREANLVVVCTDGFIGSAIDPSGASVSASAVATVRSLAVRRGTRTRINAICVPETLNGVETEIRGPLPHQVTVADLVEAVKFLTGPDGAYVSGQVIYLDAGRQLFSSATA